MDSTRKLLRSARKDMFTCSLWWCCSLDLCTTSRKGPGKTHFPYQAYLQEPPGIKSSCKFSAHTRKLVTTAKLDSKAQEPKACAPKDWLMSKMMNLEKGLTHPRKYIVFPHAHFFFFYTFRHQKLFFVGGGLEDQGAYYTRVLSYIGNIRTLSEISSVILGCVLAYYTWECKREYGTHFDSLEYPEITCVNQRWPPP